MQKHFKSPVSVSENTEPCFRQSSLFSYFSKPAKFVIIAS